LSADETFRGPETTRDWQLGVDVANPWIRSAEKRRKRQLTRRMKRMDDDLPELLATK
jgi:hypothetical protein